MIERQKSIKQWLRTASKGLETTFLALLGIYLLFESSNKTSFFLPFPWWFDKALLRTTTVVACIRLLLLGPKRWEVWLSAALGAAYALAFRATGYRFLVYLAVLTAGCSGIDYRRILKTFLWTVGVFACVTVAAAMTGAIKNFVYARRGYGIRSSWGFCYPTDFASIVLYILLVLGATWKELPDWAMLIPTAGAVLLAWVIAHSDTSIVCGLLLFAILVGCLFYRRVVERCPGLRWVGRGSSLLLLAAYPVCAAAMFMLMALYYRSTGIGVRLNELLSGRLRLSVEAWQLHGLKAFGTPFEQIGNGFSTFANQKYNFVDSSYPLIALRYGWVLLLAHGALWGWTIRRALRCGNMRLALAMGIIAVHCFSEHHFIEVNYNILLVMPFAAYIGDEKKDTLQHGMDSKVRLMHLVAKAIPTVALVALAIRLLPWFKTLFQAERLCGGGENGWKVIGILTGTLAVLTVVWWMIVHITHALIEHKPLRRCVSSATVLLACVVGLFGGALAGNEAVAKAAADYADVVEADRPALEIAAAAATGNIYTDLLPEIYHNRIDGVGILSLSGEDMARYKGDSVLMDAGAECAAMIGNGFLYSRISNAHAIYTDDDSVALALKDAGYSVTGYYCEVKDVDLAREAELNGLEYSPENGLLLDGPLQSLCSGPYLELYDGKYTVTYELQLSDGAPRDDTACNLRVSSYWGEIPLADQWIHTSQFEMDGTMSVSLPFEVQDGRGIEFLTSVDDGFQVWVRRICYARTPDYDIHTDYDRELRIIRQEYYDSDGAPTCTPDNWFACEYGYDREGNINRYCYFDMDGNRTQIARGFAELRRTYNRRRQPVREEYYGVDGEPVAMPVGSAAVEWGYDDDGNVNVYRYYDTLGALTVIRPGYAELHYVFNEAGEVVEETYFDANGQLTAVGFGYARITYDCDADQHPVLAHYWDVNGEPLQAGSGYMHEYLQSLQGRDITLVISVRGEAAGALTPMLVEDLSALGVRTDLSEMYGYGFYAVVMPESSIEDCGDSVALSYWQ